MEASIFAIIVLSLVGVAFSVGGFFMYKNDRKIRTEGRKTKAKVVDILEEYSQDGKSYRLVVEFTNYRGKIVKQKLNYASGFKPKQSVPYPMDIFYLESGDQIKILPVNSKFLFALSFIFFSVGLLCLAIVVSEFLGFTQIFLQ